RGAVRASAGRGAGPGGGCGTGGASVPAAGARGSPRRGRRRKPIVRRTSSIARVERLSRSCRSDRGSEHGFDTIAETPKFPDHLCGPALGACSGDGRPSLLVRDAVVQDLPHEATEAVCDRPDRLFVAEADHQAAVDKFEDAAFGLDRGIRRLIEEPPHLTIALGRSMAVVDAGALVMAGTTA